MEEAIGNSVYNFIDLVGTSTEGWEDAVGNAVKTSGRNLTNMRIVEVARMDIRLSDVGIVEYRARVRLSFKHEVEPETL
ncbi:MAG TPA: dodecin family protein [Methanothrix sp.]|nr:dodecin family protein [Methanothrix sp.]HPM27090.1 dodecin family protein [Methanothrix sp.]